MRLVVRRLTSLLPNYSQSVHLLAALKCALQLLPSEELSISGPMRRGQRILSLGTASAARDKSLQAAPRLKSWIGALRPTGDGDADHTRIVNNEKEKYTQTS